MNNISCMYFISGDFIQDLIGGKDASTFKKIEN